MKHSCIFTQTKRHGDKRMTKDPEADTDLKYSMLIDRIRSDFSMNFLREEIRLYSALSSKPMLTLWESYLLICLANRLQDMRAIKLISRIRDQLSGPQIQLARYIECRSARERMDEALCRISKGLLPSELYLGLKDDLGLDCLHYAIILEEKELATTLMSMKYWGEGGPVSSVGACNAFYSYFFLASIHFTDTIFLKQVFLETSSSASACVAVSRRIRSLTDIASSRLIHVNSRISMNTDLKEAAFHKGDTEEFLRLEACLDDLLEEKHDLILESEYLDRWKKQNYRDINDIFSASLADAKREASALKSGRHPLAPFLFRILGSPDDFLSYHARPAEDSYLISYRHLSFLGEYICDRSLSCISFREIADGEKRERFRIFSGSDRLYKNPWLESSSEKKESKKEKTSEKSTDNRENDIRIRFFSKDAIYDRNILRKEYHILIKQYHPDETGRDESGIILREIIEEKNMILGLKKR